MSTESQSLTTKEKLIAAGLELFGEFGYDAASLRDICRKAGVNNASINYHFGDKRSLYKAVLEAELAKSVVLGTPRTEGTGAQRLRQIVAGAMADLFSDRDTPSGRLALREISEPTEELIGLIKDPLKALFVELVTVITELAPVPIGPEKSHLVALSIFGQIDYYRIFHKFIPYLVGPEEAESLHQEKLVNHITEFSLAAISGLAPSLENEHRC